MDQIELSAEPRSVIGKQVRALRREGFLPANVYGGGDSTAIQMQARPAEHAVVRAGKSHLIRLNVDGGRPTTVLVKHLQRHPTKGTLLHVDFFRVAMDQMLRIDIPVRLIGEAPGVKSHDGSVLQTQTTVSVEAMPAELPEAVEVDISSLEDFESAIYVRDLLAPAGSTILTDGEELVVKLLPPTVEEEPEAVEGEAAEGATAEGEAAAEGSGASSSDES